MITENLGGEDGERRFALVFETGDPFVETLTGFARENDLTGAHFHGIGAVRDATLAYWNWDTKEYEDHRFEEQMEVASLTGNLTLTPDGEPKVHAHCVLGLPDASARAGHLRDAQVRPTVELFVTEAPVRLQRQRDPETGLALIRPA